MAFCFFEEVDKKIRYSDAFQRAAMRIALTSGLPRKRVAVDLGIGLLSLPRWVKMNRPGNLLAKPGLSPKFLPAMSRALGRFDARRWA